MYSMHPSIEEFGEWVWSHVSHMHDTWHGGIWYHIMEFARIIISKRTMLTFLISAQSC